MAECEHKGISLFSWLETTVLIRMRLIVIANARKIKVFDRSMDSHTFPHHPTKIIPFFKAVIFFGRFLSPTSSFVRLVFCARNASFA